MYHLISLFENSLLIYFFSENLNNVNKIPKLIGWSWELHLVSFKYLLILILYWALFPTLEKGLRSTLCSAVLPVNFIGCLSEKTFSQVLGRLSYGKIHTYGQVCWLNPDQKWLVDPELSLLNNDREWSVIKMIHTWYCCEW